MDSECLLEMADGALMYLLVGCHSHVDRTMHWSISHATGNLGLSSRDTPRGRVCTATRNRRIRGLLAYCRTQQRNVPLVTVETDRSSDTAGQCGEP